MLQDDILKVDFGARDAAMPDAKLTSTSNNTLMIPVTAGYVVLALRDGQRQSMELGYVEVPASVTEKGRAALKTIE